MIEGKSAFSNNEAILDKQKTIKFILALVEFVKKLFFFGIGKNEDYDCLTNIIIQMQLLERCMLRRENVLLAKRYAMATLKLLFSASKIPNVSFRDGDFRSEKALIQNPSSQSIELENKELYLRYVEEVLTSKEQELLQLQEHLALRRAKLDEQEGEQRLGGPLMQGQQAELLARKATALREVAFKLASNRTQTAVVKELETLQNTLAGLEEEYRKGHEAAYAELQQTMQELTFERRELAARRSKLGQLESYEKYLNELQAAIERKESQVILRERQVEQMSIAICDSNTLSFKHPQFNTYQEESTPTSNPHPNPDPDQSIRKRARIFDPRPSLLEVPQHKESSNIMHENSTNDHTKQKVSKGIQVSQPMATVSIGLQTNTQNQVSASCLRLQNERITVKFLRVWMKYSEKVNKGGVGHQKTMALYVWRLNSLFNEEAKRKIEQAIAWPRRLSSLIDYKSLSLKKRKYYELFFEHQKKLFHRQKTMVRLNTVLKNKNRRERTAVLLAFHRFKNNSRLMSLMSLFQGCPSERVLTEKPSNPTIESKAKIGSRNDSRVFASSTSNTENRLASEQSKGRLNARLTPSSSSVSKSRVMPRDQPAIDILRLKEYIKNQEETEVKLATECAQTEAVFRMCSVLATSLGRLRTRFMVNAIRIGETSKLNALQKAMSGCEFKWELFMAKARLALATNSNKIAHLEQLVGFMDCK